MTPEAKIKKMFDNMVARFGQRAWLCKPQAGPYGRAGVPDRLVCAGGKLIAAEMKRDVKHKPTPLQLIQRDEILAAGGEWHLVYDAETLAKVEHAISRAAKW